MHSRSATPSNTNRSNYNPNIQTPAPTYQMNRSNYQMNRSNNEMNRSTFEINRSGIRNANVEQNNRNTTSGMNRGQGSNSAVIRNTVTPNSRGQSYSNVSPYAAVDTAYHQRSRLQPFQENSPPRAESSISRSEYNKPDDSHLKYVIASTKPMNQKQREKEEIKHSNDKLIRQEF